ncbi:tail fiber domain-containing protein, partial [Sulfurovum sp.]|uniref:tail fiber domain-containing protein n=1 Tax=Sulfurovum sp. TaxID=1969726 RepID=UPI0025F384A1
NAQDNVFMGKYAGHIMTSGDSNVFIGRSAGAENTTGSENIFIGLGAGQKSDAGKYNVAIGSLSGEKIEGTVYGTYVGMYSGQHNTTGSGNSFFGYSAGRSNTTGEQNTFIGESAGRDNTVGKYNTFVGYYAGRHNIGTEQALPRGSFNTFLGYRSGHENQDGYGNTFLGMQSGYANVSGSFNTFVGESCAQHHTAGSFNTFIGRQSGDNANVSSSVFLGLRAGANATRSHTLYIANSDTNDPLIYGEFDTPMVKINGELNTTKAITASFEGSTDKAALKMMEISVNNTNTAKKSDVGFAMTNARENFTWSFRTWEPDSGFAISKYGNGGTKEFRLYDSDPTDATTVVLQLANGAWCDGVWHNTSSRSMKQDIQPLSTKEALEAFKKLKPVTYAYKANPTDPKVGFIAEDVPELVADPKHKSLSAMDMVALLTKVVQVQEEKLAAKEVEMKKLQKRVEKMETIMSNLSLHIENSNEGKLSLSTMGE